MNPYESPESEPTPKPLYRIKNIWSINRRDILVVGIIILPLLILLLIFG